MTDPAAAGEKIFLSRLALWFTWPSVLGEFGPVGPVDGAELTHLAPWPEPDPTLFELRADFTLAVSRVVASCEGVGVSVSGGLDSLAVLVAACMNLGDRKVVAVAANLIDDAGDSNIPIIRRIIDGLHLNCELIVVEPDSRPIGMPVWLPTGPRLDALPKTNRILSEVAASKGAEVLLTGSGADELFGTVRYMHGQFIRKRMWASLRSYWRDSVRRSRVALKLEMASMLAALLPSSARTKLYFAASWPELSSSPKATVLAPTYAELANEWTDDWVRAQLEFHRTNHSSWASMEAWDGLHPIQKLPEAGPIPIGHPFLDDQFVAVAQQLPLERRYDPSLAYPYWRQKSQVIKLLPPNAIGLIPRSKQIFASALTSENKASTNAPLLLELGLLDPKGISPDLHPMMLHRINAAEEWVRGALERGYSFVD